MAEDRPVPLSSRISGPEYLAVLHEELTKALDELRPDLVVHNAGSDVLAGDPLSHLCLSVDEMAERDLLVANEVRSRGIPLAMVLSGGYGPDSWEAHARSIEGILVRLDHE